MRSEITTTLILGSCSFELSSLTLRDASGVVVPLRSQSLRVLEELARIPGDLVPRDKLVEAIWKGIAVTDDSLAQCIKDIRNAISDSDRSIVKTVVGQGYLLEARRATDMLNVLPVILVERFRASAGTAVELSETLFEELLIRLTPRRGIIVVTDPNRWSDAKYVISGRVSERAGSFRMFFRISRISGEGDLHAGTEAGAGEEVWDLPERVADVVSAQLRIHMLMRDGEEFAKLDNSKMMRRN